MVGLWYDILESSTVPHILSWSITEGALENIKHRQTLSSRQSQSFQDSIEIVNMSFALVCVATFSCLCICKHLANTLQSACIQLEICLERSTRTRPAEAHFEPANVDELKIRMGRLERLMVRVLNAVDKPISPKSTADTQTQPQVKTEGYQHRQKPAQDPSQDNPPASSVQARSWESSVSQARKTQHNTSWRPANQTRSSESVDGSFSLGSKTWNLQISPNSTNFGKSFSKLSSVRSSNQPVRVPAPVAQVATRHKTDISPKKTVFSVSLSSMAVTYALHEKQAIEKESEEDVTLLKQISRSKGLLAGSSLVLKKTCILA